MVKIILVEYTDYYVIIYSPNNQKDIHFHVAQKSYISAREIQTKGHTGELS